MEVITLKTKDAPTANERKPVVGEQEYTFTFPLPDGIILHVIMGKQGWHDHCNVVLAGLASEGEETAAGIS